MRLLLINANTIAAMTDRLAAAAQRMAGDDIEVAGVTARFGGRYIATRATYAIAGHAALEAYAEHAAGADAVLLACFGDPGLAALREIADVPVIGMAEAACREAARRGRFAVVTGGAAWRPMLEEFVATLGLRNQLAAVRTVAPTGREIAADPAGSAGVLAAQCRAAVFEDGADVVILGGAGLIGIAELIAEQVPVPLIDGLAAAVGAAKAALREPRPGRTFAAPVGSVGLGGRLAALLAGRTAS
ncbi:MAG TPA: aspartate/glutamate racemase family protein [Xanthobacteraceae bacterium]|nr:aspartate/glutamate racemase family protein [Xanthobacteraceae bacterium]